MTTSIVPSSKKMRIDITPPGLSQAGWQLGWKLDEGRGTRFIRHIVNCSERWKMAKSCRNNLLKENEILMDFYASRNEYATSKSLASRT
jgi:hypothetical protein